MAMGTDERTVVGVFEDYIDGGEGGAAVDERGNSAVVDRGPVELPDGSGGTGVWRGAYTRAGSRGSSKRLFGNEETEAGHYGEAVRRGNAVVCVTTSAGEVDRAVEI